MLVSAGCAHPSASTVAPAPSPYLVAQRAPLPVGEVQTGILECDIENGMDWEWGWNGLG